MKNKCIIWISIIGIICSFLWMGLSFYSIIKQTDVEKSVVIVENSQMSSYGTGFIVSGADTVVTAYSTVATINGAQPKEAIVKSKNLNADMTAKVIFTDVDKNIVILKTDSAIGDSEPLLLNRTYKENENIQIYGFDGNGNILTRYDDFNDTNIIKLNGNIVSEGNEYNRTYRYSNEFNRAMIGGPACNKKGEIVGMCAYGIKGTKNTSSQYIIPAATILECITESKISYIDAQEFRIKNIIMAVLALGIVILLSIILFTAISIKKVNKKENNPDKKVKYIRILNGRLSGTYIEIKDSLSIGRDPRRCQIIYPINEPGVSALHCTVYKKDNEFYIVDNSSQYGTYLLDGQRLQAKAPYKITENLKFYIADKKNIIEIVEKKEIL